MPLSANQSDEQLREEIQNVLINSHMYEKISNELRVKLLEDGWIDRVKEMTINELLKAPEGKPQSKSYSDVLAALETPALNEVSDDVRSDILNQLKAFLNSVVE